VRCVIGSRSSTSTRPTELVVPLASIAATAPELTGPKTATLARLRAAGLPVPDGACVTAVAYRAQLARSGVEETAREVARVEGHEARRLALAVKLALLRDPLDAPVADALAAAHAAVAGPAGTLLAVRSSALIEDTPATSFAGQFDSFLGIASATDLLTAVRSCWASLWSTRALRYMATHGVAPGSTAMAVLVQRLVDARVAGGALSRTPDGEVLVTGAWGLGSSVAQGEVVPDRFVLRRDATLARVEPGRKHAQVRYSPEAGARPERVAPALVEAPCLSPAQAEEIGGMVLAAETLLGQPVEMEWALADDGFAIVQARPLRVEPRRAEDEIWQRHPGLTGHPAGIGWASGPACIVHDEHDLEHVERGCVLVTEVAGPALTAVLPRVAGVVAELGGSTSHLAALARERGIPAVLGVAGATRRIPQGAIVAVDGVAGVVRWVTR
jgi:pyruvate,water dikinase